MDANLSDQIENSHFRRSRLLRQYDMCESEATSPRSAISVYKLTPRKHIYYVLSLYPDALRRVRAEHDQKFGGVSKAAEMLCSDPTLVNDLPYTLAVIMESLRLFPPIGGSYRSGRVGQPLCCVHLKADGRDWPTYPFACFINDYAIMHHEDVFKDHELFIPERYLTKGPSDPYFVSPNAWRAFEKGPRDCIGKAMALIQIKIIIILTLSSFDFREMYADDTPLVNGHKMYQTLHVTAKPSQGCL
ncbi:cytochrome P450 [Apiospora phragmitis]|uniref:Cytochrome P450 n=1 Tax=Apiospora phragmitis TaxID=2905665 RepID=A0ABR1UHS3_9PEZI